MEESFQPDESNRQQAYSNQQTKWKKVKKATLQVCDFIFGGLLVGNAGKNLYGPAAYSAAYAMAGYH